MKLYELERDRGIRIHGLTDKEGNPKTIIFGHIDGLYSYCWIENTDTVVHLHANTELEPTEDGYKVVG